ncbi:SIS domain-containing protein [Flavobacteriaceae bacterium F89]|uniref:SIS domain-containing protein n=1 Tax=Cerina litoralis TaxID=2874477 RepID=A0AAE3EV71_9FLAO|nr:SIS domain-containing protein [Cerina litoralis]MCG2461667.1 SIS domain-containing protein [Cerina litoralis]
MKTEIFDKKKKPYTKNEIFGQPQLWEQVYARMVEQKMDIHIFFESILKKNDLRIILTGAGSSAFIGEAAKGFVQKATGKITQAIATTDIVTQPELFFLKGMPTLLISFARSGSSPESLEAIALADRYCDEVFHLIITCNKDGELAHYSSNKPKSVYCLVLPEASNDKSLAMTGSFTSMLLSVLLAFDIENIENKKKSIDDMIAQGQQLLKKSKTIAQIASKIFDRVVFLGSGPMLGIARECHLKLQELTDGQIICKHDSFLGFRHGPRAVVNDKTLMVYLFSEDVHTFKYEKDLVLSISQDPRNIPSIGLDPPRKLDVGSYRSIALEKSDCNGLKIVVATILGQLLGYYKSLQLGLNPDNPSVSGAISRVVQGVTIYPKE